MDATEKMRRIEALTSHVWMVRTFLKHSEEAEEDEELQSVHRTLYDCMHALGSFVEAGNADEYLRKAKKKLAKMKAAAELFSEIQPEISTHTNFQMARRSLDSAIAELAELLD